MSNYNIERGFKNQLYIELDESFLSLNNVNNAYLLALQKQSCNLAFGDVKSSTLHSKTKRLMKKKGWLFEILDKFERLREHNVKPCGIEILPRDFLGIPSMTSLTVRE